jgi:hypothetical protein
MQATLDLNFRQLEAAIVRLDRAVSSAESPAIQQGLAEAGSAYRGQTLEEFQANGQGGGAWPDLKPSTKLKRAEKAGARIPRSQIPPRAPRQRGGGGTLTRRLSPRMQAVAGLHFFIGYDDGDMYRSLTPGGPGSIERIQGGAWEWGSTVKYLRYFQEGRPGVQAPRRVFNEPTAATMGRVAERLTLAVGKAVGEIFGA